MKHCNAALHASPSQVSVNVAYETAEVTIEIPDNGCGFDETQVGGGHYGLVGIGERVKQMGGSLRVKSKVAEGTEISVVIPRRSIEAFEMASL